MTTSAKSISEDVCEADASSPTAKHSRLQRLAATPPGPKPRRQPSPTAARRPPGPCSHSYATHLLQGGANVRQIQRLLGHKNLTTTALHTKVDTLGLSEVIRRCHPREKGVKWG